MGYWYLKAKLVDNEIDDSGFFDKTIKKTKHVEGKVVGIGNVGFYGSHPCYMVVTKEGKNPKVEHVLIDSDQTDDSEHTILELKYRSK